MAAGCSVPALDEADNFIHNLLVITNYSMSSRAELVNTEGNCYEVQGTSRSWPESSMNSIMTFLGENDGKEEDPILLVNYLPQLTAEDPNSTCPTGPPPPIERRETIITALVAEGGHDIGGMGVAFKFDSHTALHRAKMNLGNGNYIGNVHWAFIDGLGALQRTNKKLAARIPPGPILQPEAPKLETHMVSFYSHATGQVVYDTFNFFEYY